MLLYVGRAPGAIHGAFGRSEEAVPVSNTMSLIILIVILAVAAVLAVIVYIKVQRGDWLRSFRLDKAKDLTRSSEESQGRGQGGKLL